MRMSHSTLVPFPAPTRYNISREASEKKSGFVYLVISSQRDATLESGTTEIHAQVDAYN